MSDLCGKVHNLLSSLPRFNYPFNEKAIPLNGIYILFEVGETAHLTDRIVRIGTHTGQNNLVSRLLEHFMKENKDRSIFRKNIGRALLYKSNDPFLEQWEWDLTSSTSKERHFGKVDLKKQAGTERLITQYIQKHLSFAVVSIKNKTKRLYFESRIVGLIAQCSDCKPSLGWLGASSPIPAIKNSGMWQVQKLKGLQLTEHDFEELEVLLNHMETS